jgi:hypothetical protein
MPIFSKRSLYLSYWRHLWLSARSALSGDPVCAGRRKPLKSLGHETRSFRGIVSFQGLVPAAPASIASPSQFRNNEYFNDYPDLLGFIVFI